MFTGHESLQDVIDLAVSEFLDGLRARPGFLDALGAAEREQQRRAGVHPVDDSPTGRLVLMSEGRYPVMERPFAEDRAR